MMTYQFTNTESVAEGIKRVVREEIDSAIDELTGKEIDPHEGVHQARKRFKKIRAVLRLSRAELGEVYNTEGSRFREFGRKLSAIRDAEAMIETFDRLQERFKDQLNENDFASVKDNLVKRRQVIAHEQEGLEQRSTEVVAGLYESRETLSSWPLSQDGFTAIGPGLQKVYRDGRRRFAMAYHSQTAENFHEWRKRVKNLWYHSRLLRDSWPQLMDSVIAELHVLSDHLGDDHDLVVFQQLLIEQPGSIGGNQSVQMLKTLVDTRQAELRFQAERLGHRIYAEKPSHFYMRMQVYWQAWQAEGQPQHS
jgi:CHAD domain-containing protein